MMHGFYGGPGLGGGFPLFPILAMVIFWGFVIFGIVYLIRLLVHENEPREIAPKKESKALDILEERYASGEIDNVEFAEKRHILKGGELNSSVVEDRKEEEPIA